MMKHECNHNKRKDRQVVKRGQKECENRLSSDYTGLDDFDKKVSALYKVKTDKVFEE